MGLLGGKKIYVTSVVYNLAGDENERPDYFKSTISGAILTNPKSDLAGSFKESYLTNGPGMRLRSFGRWSQGDYAETMGVYTSDLVGVNSLDNDVLAEQIPATAGRTNWVQRSELYRANPEWWANRWILQNQPDQFGTDWDVEVIGSNATITLADGTTTYTFPLVDYDPAAYYIYALYNTYRWVHHDAIPAVPGDPEADPPIPDTPEVPAWDEQVFDNLRVFLYRIGSGNAVLDAMLQADDDGSFFFPIIPLRIDNKFVGPDKDEWAPTDLDEDATEEEVEDAFKANQEAHPLDTLEIGFPEIYPMAKRALKKAIGGKFDKVVTNIAKNQSLKDIDYAYAVFGVSLNTRENAAQKYLWDLFNKFYDTQTVVDFDYWSTLLDAFKVKMDIWRAWRDGGSVGPEPEKPVLPDLGNSSIRIYSADNVDSPLNYDIMISWNAMARSLGTGLRKPDAKKGDVWWEVNPDIEYESPIFDPSTSIHPDPEKIEFVTIFKQIDEDHWEALNIGGLTYRNWIYEGKYTETTAKQAILGLDDDGEVQPYAESDFIVPIHYDTFREMSIIDSTQMSTACTYLVLNCYKVVKRKWYQTGIFQVFLIVAIIAVSVATGGIGGAGILGTNIAVGVSLGFTGTIAVIVGAVANAVVAMLILKAVGTLSTALFGDKFGAIIGAIAGVVAITVGTGLLNGGNLSASFGQLARADNIIAMTSAAGEGIQGYVAAAIKDISESLEEMQRTYAEQSQTIDDLYAENIGSGRAYVDPMKFTNVGKMVYETSDTFLTRTLMTGSDVADFSLSLLTNFAEWTISSDLP